MDLWTIWGRLETLRGKRLTITYKDGQKVGGTLRQYDLHANSGVLVFDSGAYVLKSLVLANVSLSPGGLFLLFEDGTAIQTYDIDRRS